MFPDYFALKALVDDHQGRLHRRAGLRRILRAGRRDDLAACVEQRSFPVDAAPIAARTTVPTGRTPVGIDRAA